MQEIKYEGKASTFVWIFENPMSSSWYDKKWRNWLGWAGPCVYIYRRSGITSNDKVTKIHELHHCKQHSNWGIFMYPAYFINSAWILFSNLFRKNKQHAHLDNLFEKEARKAAGQTVKVPSYNWPQGPKDYNPWI